MQEINVQIYQAQENENHLHITEQIAKWWGEMETAIDDVGDSAGQKPPKRLGDIIGGSDDYSNSGVAITTAFQDFYWRREYSQCFIYNDSRWESVISQARPTDEGLGYLPSFYEWRYMVPYILTAIPFRLQVISSAYPNWGIDGSVDATLKDYASGLSKHLSKMTEGVKCAKREDLSAVVADNHPIPGVKQMKFTAACADIFTGLSQYAEFNGTKYPGPGGEAAESKLKAQADAFLPVARSSVIQRMPLFEIKSMVDALHYYRSHAADLTELQHRIPLAAINACLEERGNKNPVGLATCSRAYTQNWLYDRATGQIRNPYVGRCLTIPHDVQPVPGTPVVSAACGDGNRYRKWTYDPTTQRLSNAFGTVLGGDWVGQGRVYLAYDHSGDQGQRWLADGPIPRSIPSPLMN